jgi:GNAT superfamily N-acetyltransferase
VKGKLQTPSPKPPFTIKVNMARLQFQFGDMPNPGMQALWFYHPDYDTPIGFVWFKNILRAHIFISYIFVHEACRRQGVATRMLSELCVAYPRCVICTAVGNEMSEPWLRKNRFVEEPAGWFLRPEVKP